MSQPLSQKVMRCARKAAPACLTVWALALAACGGSDGTSPPDLLQPYRAGRAMDGMRPRHSGPSQRRHERAARQPAAALRPGARAAGLGQPRARRCHPCGHAPGCGQARSTARRAAVQPGRPRCGWPEPYLPPVGCVRWQQPRRRARRTAAAPAGRIRHGGLFAPGRGCEHATAVRHQRAEAVSSATA